jgi:hypothetical protein
LDNKKDVLSLLSDLSNKNIDKVILKSKKQRKEGLKITSDIDFVSKAYKDDYLVAQELIDPLLVNNRKVNLRIYMMLEMYQHSINVYLNKVGSCIYTKNEHDSESYKFEDVITSYKVGLDVYDDNPLTLEQLRTYLNDNNIDYEKVFNGINRNVSIFINTMKDQLDYDIFPDNKCVQVFGLDFVIDKNLNPLLLECNKGPDMKPRIITKELPDEDDITDNMGDMIEDLQNYLSNCDDNVKKVKKVKESYIKLFKNYPKMLSYADIVENINKYYDNEKSLNSYPIGYISGNGLKVQYDTLSILELVDNKYNNGYYLLNKFVISS